VAIVTKLHSFEARHLPQHPFENLACELAGVTRIYKTSGKVKAWTRWGARRLIRKLFGRRLIEIVSIERVSS
jgi:hypothetical protein